MKTEAEAAIRRALEAVLVPVGVSQRHVHLSEQDAAVLFGRGHRLNPRNPLSQPGQFAACETVILAGPKGRLERVRVLGPCRKQTQVELSQGDCYTIGVAAPLRLSGHLEETPGCILLGPAGSVSLNEGVIVPRRHLHLSPEHAAKCGLRDGQAVRIRIGGEAGIVLEQVLVRAGPGNVRELHLTIDEANAARVKTGDLGAILERGDLPGEL